MNIEKVLAFYERFGLQTKRKCQNEKLFMFDVSCKYSISLVSLIVSVFRYQFMEGGYLDLVATEPLAYTPPAIYND